MSAAALTAHAERIRSELRKSGMSNFSLLKPTSHYVEQIIRSDEHIIAAVTGRHRETESFFGLTESMLIATDQRIIYINHLPGYTTMDEVGYDIVSGINKSIAGLYGSLTLFTKINNYTLSFARRRSVQNFTNYVESRRVTQTPTAPNLALAAPATLLPSGTPLANFLNSHELAVLSSIDRTGNVNGAAVYYTILGGRPYFITKSATRKAVNILGNPHVALTVFDEAQLQTAQIQGVVEQESDAMTNTEAERRLTRVRQYASGMHLPPAIRRNDSTYMVLRITPTNFVFTDYSK